jgi:hypothetical protein
LEAVQELQKAFGKNYYLDFIIPLDEAYSEINLYSELVTYRGKEYLEKDVDILREERKYILEDIKTLYNNAISEVYLKLSSFTNDIEKINFLNNTNQLFQVHLKELKDDFYVNEKSSRYHSTININNNIVDMNDFGKNIHNILNDEIEPKIKKIEYNIIDLYDILLTNMRIEVLSFLPYSIFIIANNFLKFLNDKVEEINNQSKESNLLKDNNEESQKKPNQLSSNQIVILLDQLQVLVDSKMNKLPKTKQAELISLITGLNSQNIRVNLGKLEKKPSTLNDNYQRDNDKIKQILERFK